MKRINKMRRWICAMLAVVLTVAACVEPAQAVTGYSSVAWVDNLDFADINGSGTPIQMVYTMEQEGSFLATSYVFNQERLHIGDTIYIRDRNYICSGKTYYGVIYKGRLMYVNKKYINEKNLVSVKQPKYVGKQKVVKKTIVGDLSDQNNWFYIYSKPDEQPVNCYGVLSVGETLEILKKDYNSEWTQIKWQNRICYIKKNNVSYADSYLVGADRDCQLNIRLAKKAKLTYSGILKDYDKGLTEKEFYKLAALWCKATGKKTFTSSKKVTNKVLTKEQYNSLLKKMVNKTKVGNAVYKAASVSERGVKNTVTRDSAISQFYRAYQVVTKDYLISGLEFTISPVDNTGLYCDIWGTKGENLYLEKRSGGREQNFYLNCNNGFWRLRGCYGNYTICSSTKDVYQDFTGYDNQKLTIVDNGDGTVSFMDKDGLYLDLIDGAVLHSHLKFAPKSDSSTQKFVIHYN